MVRVVHKNRATVYPNNYNYACTKFFKYRIEPEASKPISRYTQNLKLKCQILKHCINCEFSKPLTKFFSLYVILRF